MSFSNTSMLYLLLLVKLAAIAASTPAAATATAIAKPECPSSCGNISIPYPFGTSEGCYLNTSFLVTCNDSNLFLAKSNLRVLSISEDGEFRISSWVSSDCYNQSTIWSATIDAMVRVSYFPISSTKNKFVVIGCDSYAYVRGSLGVKYSTGCMAFCDTINDVVDGSCSGIGCCETDIPEGVKDFNLSARFFQNHTFADFNPCSFAFVVENGTFDFSSSDLISLSNVDTMRVVVDWAIGNSCEEAENNMTTYACGGNSTCYNPDNVLGYRCNCSQGYTGNPYLSDGCQDINECLSPELNPCTSVSSINVCDNTNGGFTCTCPRGYHGDGRKDGQGCISNKLWQKIIIGVGTTILVSLIVCILLCLGIKRRRKFIKQK